MKDPGTQSAPVDEGSNFRLAPVMAAALAFSAGILLAKYVWHPFWMWVVAAALVGAGAESLCRRPRA